MDEYLSNKKKKGYYEKLFCLRLLECLAALQHFYNLQQIHEKIVSRKARNKKYI